MINIKIKFFSNSAVLLVSQSCSGGHIGLVFGLHSDLQRRQLEQPESKHFRRGRQRLWRALPAARPRLLPHRPAVRTIKGKDANVSTLRETQIHSDRLQI
jgi:hypothetical protein